MISIHFFAIFIIISLPVKNTLATVLRGYTLCVEIILCILACVGSYIIYIMKFSFSLLVGNMAWNFNHILFIYLVS